jgi:hypothetical protein
VKKLLLLSVLATMLISSGAQRALQWKNGTQRLIEGPAVGSSNTSNLTPRWNGAQRASTLHSILHSQRIGSSSNISTVLANGCKQIDVDSSLTTITFIHSNDTSGSTGTNGAQYRFDKSSDNGNTWTVNIGPITNNPAINNINVNGRFPQAVIYNPAGNTLGDSARLVYSGSWHNDPGTNTGSWQGQMCGRGKLSGDTSTFNVHIDVVNNGQVEIGTGLHQGAPGVFWTVTPDFNGTFATSSNLITNGVVVEKGVWDAVANDVNWTDTVITQNFYNNQQLLFPSGDIITESYVTGWNIAFDPSGQYGWIACLADISVAGDSVYQPVFWKSIDSGHTWTGPIFVTLKNIQGIVSRLAKTNSAGLATSGMPTTSFEDDLTVDIYGRPHLLTTIGNSLQNGVPYTIDDGGYDVVDITYYPNDTSGCQWQALPLDRIYTLRGTYTTDRVTEDNRPLISRTADGAKIFFFWTASDAVSQGFTNNDNPNLFGRGIDVVNEKMTPKRNFTLGDTLWGGGTVDSAAGLFGGAIFPVVSQTCLYNSAQGSYNIPLVLTQIDYEHNPTTGQGLSTKPAAFWYINNINYSASEFNLPIDQVPPIVTLNGPDTIYVLLHTAYNDPGATAFDCVSGNITPVVQNTPDTSRANIYPELYIATDSAGNSDTAKRVVMVEDVPQADFYWTTPTSVHVPHFFDHSTNIPTQWHWFFYWPADSRLDSFSVCCSTPNPIEYLSDCYDWTVCLISSNHFGSSSIKCDTFDLGCEGINEVDADNSISVHPNPTNSLLYIKTENINAFSNAEMVLYDMNGQLIRNEVFKAQIDVSNLSSGVYFIEIKTGDMIARKRFVKM